MSSIEECSTDGGVFGTRILVGVPPEGRTAAALLSWAVRFAAPRKDDTVVAVHVIVVKDEKRVHKTKLRLAKAFVISMLADFADVCQTKQVKLEAKIRCSSSVGKGLIEEAASIKANFLLVGGSRSSSQRSSLDITSHCFMHAPEGCLVIAIGKQCQSQYYTDSDSVACEELIAGKQSLSSRWSGIALIPLRKLFGSKPKREKSSPKRCLSSWSSISTKSSPRAVLDGLEEDYSSPLSNEISTGGSSRTGIWRRLSAVKFFFPFFPSTKESDACSPKDDQRPSWRCFNYDEISSATNNFHSDNMVGKGGYAEVYRGNLYNGQTVAVKRLAKHNTDEQKEREFLTELGIIGHVCHPNTVYFIGCCIENGFHLIFEYSTNGTLASALHSKNSKLLEWHVRYNIVVGIVRGLHYLHKCCRRRIIHRDIKASNVLLGPDFNPQISDFGLAKWLPRQWTHHCAIPIEGTIGYLAPEYFMHGIVDEKTDVFAFGVLLLEIITGRRPVNSSNKSLLLWAKPLMESGKVAELVDPKLGDKYDMDELKRLVLIASYCTRNSPLWRPSMSEVLQFLGETDESSEVAESWSMSEPENKVDYSADCDHYYLAF